MGPVPKLACNVAAMLNTDIICVIEMHSNLLGDDLMWLMWQLWLLLVLVS